MLFCHLYYFTYRNDYFSVRDDICLQKRLINSTVNCKALGAEAGGGMQLLSSDLFLFFTPKETSPVVNATRHRPNKDFASA
jgi:hypothetical protein